MRGEVRVLTGEERWQIHTKEDIFWIEIWAIEAIAKVIRHVDSLGENFALYHEGNFLLEHHLESEPSRHRDVKKED